MKTYGGMDVQIHVFLTSAQVGDEQLHAPAALLPAAIGYEAMWAPKSV
jgi:hypothetical protein